MIDSPSTSVGTSNGHLAQPAQEAVTVIKPPSGWAAINVKQLWLFRDLLVALGTRDVKLRYRQTALGVIWVVAQPLMAAAIMSFVFTKIASAPTDGVPPFLFAYVGMLGWTAFANTVTKASAVMIQNSNLVSKIFFPRLLLPFSTIFSVLVDTAVGAAVCILLLVIYHITPSVTILLAPLLFLMMLVLALGVGLFTSALAVSYRDVQYVIPVMVQILFFACPVAYSTSKVSGAHALFFDLNPMTPLIQAFRWSVIGTGTFKPTALVISLIFSVAIFLFGAVFFKKSEAKFADVI